MKQHFIQEEGYKGRDAKKTRAGRLNDLENESIVRMELDNGLTLELLDRSRKIAGDRWFVSFSARVEMELKPEYLETYDIPGDKISIIQAIAGEKACFNYENKRNFIADEKKDAVLKEMKEGFLAANLKYLSSPEFPKKLMLSKLNKKS